MRYHQLGKSELRVSAVALGCWAIVGDATWGHQEEADSIAAIEAALEAGINFFDTAEVYGNGYSEQLLGKALGLRRREAVIASKAAPEHLARGELASACAASLKRLRTDYIDLYQVHWPSPSVPYEETIGELEKLRKSGKIRVAGVSNFGPIDLRDYLAKGGCAGNQLAYSLLFRAVEFELQELCVKNDVSILPYSPLAQGLLTGKFRSADEVPEGRARTRLFSKNRPQSRHQEPGCEKEVFAALARLRELAERLGEPMEKLALAWLLHQRGVASVIAGARDPEQVRANAAAAELRLPEEVLREMTEATDPVKQALGPNLDQWLTQSRIR